MLSPRHPVRGGLGRHGGDRAGWSAASHVGRPPPETVPLCRLSPAPPSDARRIVSQAWVSRSLSSAVGTGLLRGQQAGSPVQTARNLAARLRHSLE